MSTFGYTDHYVYIIFRPNGVPCYVGKGRGKRWMQHANRTHNQHLARIYAKAGGQLPACKVQEGLTNAEAMAVEIALIGAFGRSDKKMGPLVNHTDGGEGASGISNETRQRKSERLKDAYASGRRARPVLSPERIASMVAKSVERNKGRPMSAETKEKIRNAQIGVPKSAEHTAKNRQSHLGYSPTPEHRANISRANRGKPKNNGPQISVALKGRKKDPAAVAASVAAKQLALAQRREAGIIRYWWHRPDGSLYLDSVARSPMDTKGHGRKAPEALKISCKGKPWWCSVSGKSYRAMEARNSSDRPGRRYA